MEVIIETPQQVTVPEAANSRFFWLSVAVAGACFFVTEHSFRVSLIEHFNESAGELAALASGGNTVRRVAFLCLAVLGACCFWYPSDRPCGLTSALGMLILFSIAWCTSSILWSIDPSMTFRRLIVLLCCFVGAMGVSRQLSVRDLARLSLVVTTSFLAIGVGTEIVLGTFRPWAADYRFAGTVHPNTQGLNLAVLCFSAYCLTRDTKRAKFLLRCLLCIGFTFLVLTKSRSSCGGTLFGLALLWSLRAALRTKLLAAVGIVAVATAVALVNMLMTSGIEDNLTNAALLGRTEQSGSLTGRVPLWTELSTYIRERPLQGYGYDTFWTSENIASVSSALQWGIHEAHSSYVETMLNVGIIGAIPLLACVALATWRARRQYLTTGETGYDFFFALFMFSLANSFTESGMVMPMFVPFLAACGLARLAFYPLRQAEYLTSQTNGVQRELNPQLSTVGA